MKKFLLSFGFIFIFASYFLYQKQGGFSNAVSVTTQDNSAPAPVQTPATIPQNNPISNFISRFSDEGGGGDDEGRRLPPKKTTTTTTTTTKTIPTPVQKTIPSSTPAVAQGMYKDGTYTGSNEYAYSDYIQVSAVIQGGKLVNVQFPSSASGPRRSQQIYSYSMPELKSEAISAQSANVNSISGASYTSQAFAQSLATALASAKN